MTAETRLDYLAIGHVTIDVLPDGSRQPGGSVLYAALQAARLGRRAMILTRGVPAELRRLLEPYLDELQLIVQPAAATTTLQTAGVGTERRQRMLAWAGPIEPTELPATAVLHLAPVAAELLWAPPRAGAYVGLTPQGLLRHWSASSGEVHLGPPSRTSTAIGALCDAVVVSAQEREACSELLQRASAAGALVAVTAGELATEVLLPDGRRRELPVRRVERPVDDLGAGDVYASALFIALAQGDDIDTAAALASRSASLRMLGHGPGAIGRPDS
jgi:sugar/nucleoside kinase (ribokinase family)